jgi:Flp pilus assembly protein TadG
MLLPGRRANWPLPAVRSVASAYPNKSDLRPRRGHDRGQSVVEFALVLPIMVILLFAIADFARIYTTMMSVESAAREAADFGTTLGAIKWQAGSQMDTTVQEMRRRACVASSNLPDYADPDDPTVGNCTNPSFDYCMTPTVDGTCGPVDPLNGCDVPTRVEPCTVTVTLTYNFHLISPVNIEIFGVRLGFPSTLTFKRDSTFAMTDIDLSVP